MLLPMPLLMPFFSVTTIELLSDVLVAFQSPLTVLEPSMPYLPHCLLS